MLCFCLTVVGAERICDPQWQKIFIALTFMHVIVINDAAMKSPADINYFLRIKSVLISLFFLVGFALNQQLYSQDGWIPQESGTSFGLLSVCFAGADTGWTVGEVGTILKTNNGGKEWIPQISGTTDLLYCVFFLDARTGWIVGTRGTILKTIDSGINWVPQTSGTNELLESIFFLDQNTGWASGEAGTILSTTDGGQHWTHQVSNTLDWLGSIYFFDCDTGFAVGKNGAIFKSTDGGSTWSLQTSGTSNNLCSVFFTDHQTGWAVGIAGTILQTSDGGANWIPQISGTSNLLFSVNFTDDTTGWVVGANGTILKTTTGGITSIDEIQCCKTTIPQNFDLLQNYPNPFNLSTNIKYSLKKSNHVSLKIYNLLGQKIKILVDEYQTAGVHEICWIKKELPSGIYFYNIKSGEYSATKKLILENYDITRK